MIRTLAATACLFPLLVSSSIAGPIVATAPVPLGLTESLICGVTNASTKKSIEVDVRSFNVNGGSNCAPSLGVTLAPLGATFHSCAGDHYCVVEVISGGKKNARLAATIYESNVLRAAFPGQ